MTITNLTQTITNYLMKNEMFIVNLGIVRAFMVKFNCFSSKMLTFKQTKVQKVSPARNMRILSTNIREMYTILSRSDKLASFVTMKIFVREKFRIFLAGTVTFYNMFLKSSSNFM